MLKNIIRRKPKKNEDNILIEKSQEEKKSRDQFLEELSRKYIKYINEPFEQNYKKTVLQLEVKNDPFHITIYSEKPVSTQLSYCIASTYNGLGAGHDKTMFERFEYGNKKRVSKKRFMTYLDGWHRSKYTEEITRYGRMKLYEHVEDGLIIVLDVEPEMLGLNPEIMSLTTCFNEKKDNGKYKTIIKAYDDFYIVLISSSPCSIEEAKSIKNVYRAANSGRCVGEELADYNEFLEALQKDLSFYKKIKLYEYKEDFLLIEVD